MTSPQVKKIPGGYASGGWRLGADLVEAFLRDPPPDGIHLDDTFGPAMEAAAKYHEAEMRKVPKLDFVNDRTCDTYRDHFWLGVALANAAWLAAYAMSRLL